MKLRTWRGGLAAVFFAGLGFTAPPDSAPAVDSFEAALPLLDKRAAMYEKAALGFSCEETVIEGKFNSRTGENKREQKNRYDYLYEGNPETGFREVRMKPSFFGEPKPVDPDLSAPGAYDWALLFTPQYRSHFRFELAGKEQVGFHQTIVIGFRGTKTFDRGRDISEWSGRAWVDSETGNFVKVEATPNDQDELLPLRTAEWMKALRIAGMPVKHQPRGYRYRLLFTVEKFGLLFPGEAETRLFALTGPGEEEIRERIAQKFRNYVFFNVHSAEEFAGANPPPPDAKPTP